MTVRVENRGWRKVFGFKRLEDLLGLESGVDQQTVPPTGDYRQIGVFRERLRFNAEPFDHFLVRSVFRD